MRRHQFGAVHVDSENRQAAVCSTSTSAAPGTFCKAAATFSPVSLSTVMSSPKSFTATPLRTLEINSSKRSYIGWETS